MSRQWQPGDVAMVTYRLGQCIERNICAKTDKGWDCLAPGVGFLMHGDVIEIRPLVVIDPEDREQVERLADGMWNLGLLGTGVGHGKGAPAAEVTTMQAALREFADPKPPRPDEPLGLGAVVEDVEGNEWVRHERVALGDMHWRPVGGTTVAKWRAIDAVRVRSEGVTDA